MKEHSVLFMVPPIVMCLGLVFGMLNSAACQVSDAWDEHKLSNKVALASVSTMLAGMAVSLLIVLYILANAMFR
jgi:hypothetical protein